MRNAVVFAASLPEPPSTSAALAGHQQLKSTWHSPVSYLFCGLAAMLLLIAFALLILAYSYWKHCRSNVAGAAGDEKKPTTFETRLWFPQGVVVIMPGDDKPTQLALPVWNYGPTMPLAGKDEVAAGGGGYDDKKVESIVMSSEDRWHDEHETH